MALDFGIPVLVVDDYQTMVRIIRNLLKQLGFENVDEASDGGAALDKLRAKRYGLVISDWNMEPMTGYELLRHVRADEELKTTPFIMITAESKTENVVAAKKAGVNNYIVKPFNAQTLKTKIEAVCGNLRRFLGRKSRGEAILELTSADLWRPIGRAAERADLHRISNEVEAVAEYVTRLRKEIARLKLNETLTRSIPTCKGDLTGAQTATEEATHIIMTASEAVLGSTQTDFDAYRVEVEAALLEILQACSFQDLTGQRLTRAMEAIAQIEKRLQRFAKTVRISDAIDIMDRDTIVREARREALLVEGPQDFGKAIQQGDIDKLFS